MRRHSLYSYGVRSMKPTFEQLLRRGHRTAVIEATFAGIDQHGHTMLKDVQTKAGEEDHVWLNIRGSGMLPPLSKGQRVRFLADLQPYKKRDGSRSIRLECAREAQVVA